MAANTIQQAKACTKCGELKPLEQYSVQKTVRDGRRSRCKKCEAEIALARYHANREQYLNNQRKRYAADPEKFRALALKWHADNTIRANKRSAKWKADNPAAVAAYNKEYYAENRQESKDRFRSWVQDNALRRKEYMRLWHVENPEKNRSYSKRRLENIRVRIENAVRCRIWATIIRGSKNGRRSLSLLGYSAEDLRAHIQRQFSQGMTWDNYGEWHIDHVIPLSSFNYQTPDDPEFKAAWAMTNLRPLWKIDNLRKGAKRLTLL